MLCLRQADSDVSRAALKFGFAYIYQAHHSLVVRCLYCLKPSWYNSPAVTHVQIAF